MGPTNASVATSISYTNSEGSTTVATLDGLPYGNAQNSTESSAVTQYQQYPSPAYYAQRPYTHIISTPQAALTPFKGHPPVTGYLYQQPGPQAGYPMVQAVRYPANAATKTSGDSRSVTPDQPQGGPIPDISTLRQPATTYQGPYGQVSYQGVIHQPSQGSFASPYQQPYGAAFAVSPAATTATSTVYSAQPGDQGSFQFGYSQGAGQGYPYPYLNTPPPAYSTAGYINQMNSTPPPNAVAGQQGSYQLTPLVPGQGGATDADRTSAGMATAPATVV